MTEIRDHLLDLSLHIRNTIGFRAICALKNGLSRAELPAVSLEERTGLRAAFLERLSSATEAEGAVVLITALVGTRDS